MCRKIAPAASSRRSAVCNSAVAVWQTGREAASCPARLVGAVWSGHTALLLTVCSAAVQVSVTSGSHRQVRVGLSVYLKCLDSSENAWRLTRPECLTNRSFELNSAGDEDGWWILGHTVMNLWGGYWGILWWTYGVDTCDVVNLWCHKERDIAWPVEWFCCLEFVKFRIRLRKMERVNVTGCLLNAITLVENCNCEVRPTWDRKICLMWRA
jgi:hypothetical protein